MNHWLAKKTFLIPTTMLIAIGLVSILAWTGLKPINEKTGFTRKFITAELKPIKTVEIAKDVINFAGSTEHHIYFQTKDPAKIYVTDKDLKKGEYISFKIPKNPKIASQFNCVVDSPAVYILAGNLPGIIKTQLNDTGSITYRFPGALFTRSALISNNTFVLRMFDHLDQVFVKGNIATGEMIKEKDISEKKNDAGISTDGCIVYDKASNSLAYINYFKNEILFLDTTLNLTQKVKTIDLNTNTAINAGELKSQSLITNFSPKRLVNACAALYKDHLYINSKIKGDNETFQALINNAVIDIYSTKDGISQGSFYLQGYEREHLKNFQIFDNKILALYSNHLMLYAMSINN